MRVLFGPGGYLLTLSFQGFDILMHYFVSSEIGVANFLHRQFEWPDGSLWYEEIPHAKDPSKSMFVVGGKDFILNPDVRKFLACFGRRRPNPVPLQRVAKYLRSHGVDKGLLYTPEHTHGQALLRGSTALSKIMDWLAEC